MFNSALEKSYYHSSFSEQDYYFGRARRNRAPRAIQPIIWVEYIEAPDYREMRITYFVSDRKKYRIEPPLNFLWKFDAEINLYEIKGSEVYEDILVYGEKLDHAAAMLEREILPLLWEDYTKEEDKRLSAGAQKIKKDLLARVKE